MVWMNRLRGMLLALSLLLSTLHTISLANAASPTYSLPIISTGYNHTCAVTSSGTAKCWGNDGFRQVSNLPHELGWKTVSAGRTNTCGITTGNLVKCWGDNSVGQSLVPTNLGKVKQISVGGYHSCAVTDQSLARCWGENALGESTIPSDLGLVSQISAGYGHTCALSISGQVRCWGLDESNQSRVPTDLGKSINVVAGIYSTCALSETRAVRCWGSTNYAEPELGAVIEVSLGSTFICVVTATGVAKCLNFEVPSDIGQIEHISAGYGHVCAVTVLGAVRCWGENTAHQTESPVFVLAPAAPKNVVVEQDENGSVIVRFEHQYLESDGTLSWTIKNVANNQIVCVNDANNLECKVPNLKFGNSYTFSVQGMNESGKSAEVQSASYRYCPTEPSSFQVAADKAVVQIGTATTIRGQLRNLCGKPPSYYFVRTKEAGSTWTSWIKNKLGVNGGFAIKSVFKSNTNLEFKTTLSNGQTLVQSLKLGVSIKTVLPLSFSWQATKNKQGFNQGGLVKVSFSGDSVYSGMCVILGTTAEAYNFALTYVGSESKFSYFNVRNGRGQGRIQMAWNGRSRISVSCTSSKFQDIFDFRLPIFRANF